MRLLLDRSLYDTQSTVGDLYVNGVYECVCMEPGTKEISHPAVPEGIYSVKLTWSPRYKRILPLLIDVPGRDGIRIHPGNVPDDTLGCLLPGEELKFVLGVPSITHSTAAFNRLFEKLKEAEENSDPITCEVVK